MRKLSHITILDEYAVDMGVVLGQGSTGCVYQGINMKNSTKVAIKIIDLRTIDNQVASYLLNMEKKAIMIINSPYVLRGLKVAEDSRYCFLVTEFCNGGTLKKFIKNSPGGRLPEETALKFIFQIMQGYRSLAEKGVIHRDLKPANIMLHQDNVKIIDFGYCSIEGYPTPTLEYNVGSPSYMAPESFDRNVYNEKTEIWAIGVILFECVTGKTIDQGRYMPEVYHELQTLGVPYPDYVSSHIKNIINWCLSSNPKNRPTCRQLIQTYFDNKAKLKSKVHSVKVQGLTGMRNKSNLENRTINEIKMLRQKSPNRVLLMDKQDELFKSARIDNKSKYYKLPEFLQASTKISTKEVQKSYSGNYGQLTENLRVKPSKPGKLYRNQVQKENGIKKDPSQPSWEYGATAIPKNSSLFFEKRYDYLEASKKVDRNGLKERVISVQVSASPFRGLKKSPKKLYSNLSKDGLIRNKRTFTDRFNLIRA